jgi:SAM-dependent methyltransferase
LDPAAPAGFTGERFLPDCSGTIALEHWHRYALARRFGADKRVLDAASGEGYGTAHLAEVARLAVGVDIDAASVAAASRRYQAGGARYVVGSVASLPFPDASFDLIVSFETVEHIDAAMQRAMIAEFARVLTPEGTLLVSSPNRAVYSDRTGYRNEFHVHELYRDELDDLLAGPFDHRRWYAQSVHVASGCFPEQGVVTSAETTALRAGGPSPLSATDPVYYLVAASRGERASDVRLGASTMVDVDEIVLGRQLRAETEGLRLDRLLVERTRELEAKAEGIAQRDAALARLTRAVDAQRVELEALAAETDVARAEVARLEQILEQRDRTDQARLQELHAHIRDRDQVVFYRQSWRWWLKLPLIRAKWYVHAVLDPKSEDR